MWTFEMQISIALSNIMFLNKRIQTIVLYTMVCYGIIHKSAVFFLFNTKI